MSTRSAPELLYWLPLICGSLHMIDEFVWPGGFTVWYRDFRPSSAISFTPAYAAGINGLFLATAALLGWIGPTWSRGVSLWLTLATVLAANAVLVHIRGAMRLRRYSPGIITGIALSVLLAAWGYWHFVGSGEATPALALGALAIGVVSNFVMAGMHEVRTALFKTTPPSNTTSAVAPRID